MDETLQGILEHHKNEQGTLIGLLQDIQEKYGYLPEERLEEVAHELNVPLGRLFSLATFYHSFRLKPLGKHHICVCVGTACHVRGGPAITDTIERDLNVKAGTTSDDGMFTLDTVNCLGACALAPLIMIDNEHHGNMDQKKIKKLLKNYSKEE